jgi:flagellar motor switch/type III secretory pathway protein FliN
VDQSKLKPFPWQDIPYLWRNEVEAARSVRQLLTDYIDWVLVNQVASKLLAKTVEIRLHQVQIHQQLPMNTQAISVPLKSGELGPWVRIDVELDLAARLVASVLEVHLPFLQPNYRHSPEIRGAVTAFLIALSRRTSFGEPFRVAEVIPPHANTPLFEATFLVFVEDEVFRCSALVPLPLIAPSLPNFTTEVLRGLGEIKLQIPVVAAVSLATRAQLDSLEVGTAWAPGDAWTLRRQADQWQGTAVLVAPTSEHALNVQLLPRQPTLYALKFQSKTSSTWELAMNNTEELVKSDDQPAEALADVPVVVRVEVGTVTLSAKEWASLHVGDVIATGVRVGNPVILRVGGLAVAEGELCNLEGEVAVRILKRKGKL